MRKIEEHEKVCYRCDGPHSRGWICPKCRKIETSTQPKVQPQNDL